MMQHIQQTEKSYQVITYCTISFENVFYRFRFVVLTANSISIVELNLKKASLITICV